MVISFGIQHAVRMRRIILSSVACSVVQYNIFLHCLMHGTI